MNIATTKQDTSNQSILYDIFDAFWSSEQRGLACNVIIIRSIHWIVQLIIILCYDLVSKGKLEQVTITQTLLRWDI